MEEIDKMKAWESDFMEIDDVLDESFFTSDNLMDDVEDEDFYEWVID